MASNLRIPAAAVVFLLVAGAGCLHDPGTLNGHRVAFDAQGNILAWDGPQDRAWDQTLRRALDYLVHRVPLEAHGKPAYYSRSCMERTGRAGLEWPHNPAGTNAMLADAALAVYAYTGDPGLPDLVTGLLDHQLARGTTPPDYVWASVPWSSGAPGSLDYQGAGPGDAPGVLEPDKVGELGLAYLKWHRFTGRNAYLQGALACANALAAHVQAGNADASPWPFRVVARTGEVVDPYGSHVIANIRLFEGLMDLGLGDTVAYGRARDLAWAWLQAYPMRTGLWYGSFEDIETRPKEDNPNQYAPLETARYLLEHPERDPQWEAKVRSLLAFVEEHLIFIDVPHEPAVQWGARVVSEQWADRNRMASHTARYASILALLAARTGDAEARTQAFHSYNWATYMCRTDGVVNTGPRDGNVWWTDGYGDFLRLFLAGMAAHPAWAPPGANHLLSTTSLVRDVAYSARTVTYHTAEASGTEVLRLGFTPAQITLDGAVLAPLTPGAAQGWAWDAGTQVLTVRRAGGASVEVVGP